jgi:hypothetical protein
MSLYETIQYEVLETQGKIEIRRYDEFLLAATKSENDITKSSGFNNVFQYISGDNQEKKKISMTTPVVSYEEEDNLVTGFYVPSKYNKQSVPKPTSKNVYIEEVKSGLFAVIKFKGSWTEKNLSRYDDTLRSYLHTTDYEIISQRFLLRYQPPFIPGIFRRNEIAYQIKSRI